MDPDLSNLPSVKSGDSIGVDGEEKGSLGTVKANASPFSSGLVTIVPGALLIFDSFLFLRHDFPPPIFE